MKTYNFVPKHFRLLSPKCNLDISKNNYFVRSIILWNKCISKLPDLLSLSHRSHLIISGHNANSDLTIPIGTFKNRLKNFLLKTQNLGISSDWSQQNFISDSQQKIVSCGWLLFYTHYMYIYLVHCMYIYLVHYIWVMY